VAAEGHIHGVGVERELDVAVFDPPRAPVGAERQVDLLPARPAALDEEDALLAEMAGVLEDNQELDSK
jgi:hypothetical protein